jgi:hypothetical protein
LLRRLQLCFVKDAGRHQPDEEQNPPPEPGRIDDWIILLVDRLHDDGRDVSGARS